MTAERENKMYRSALTTASVFVLTLMLLSTSHAEVKWESVTMAPVSVAESELYHPAKGGKVFSDREFVWSQVPKGLKSAWRTKYEGLDPVTVDVKGPGRVLALLWVWDFGFLRDGPRPAKQLNGWQLVDAEAARAEIYPYALRLYSRPIAPGSNTIHLKEYFGQWIILGVEEGQPTDEALATTPAVEVSGGKMRHNIFDPGKQATVRVKTTDANADQTVVWELFNDGEKLSSGEASAADAAKGIPLTVPEHPNRYWLQVGLKGHGGRRVVPLTTALPAIEEYASIEKRFPLFMWVHADSMPQVDIRPTVNYLVDLDIIDQVELGATVFDVGEKFPIVKAMNGMRRAAAHNTKYAVREVAKSNVEVAARMVVDDIRKHGPYGKEVIGIYAADEPPHERPELFTQVEKLWEKEGAEVTEGNRPPPPLLYCLIGYGADYVPEFWIKAKAKVRMSREYPILNRGRHGEPCRRLPIS